MKRTSKNSNNRIKELFNGHLVKVSGVSPALIDQVQASVKDPAIPIFKDPDTGDEYENPTDPAYVREVQNINELRQRRALQAIIMFGLELVDEEGNPVEPPDDGWERKLKRVGLDWEKEMLTMLNQEEWADEEDRLLARKDAYVLFIAFSGHQDDVNMVMSLAGANQLAQQQAEEMFQRPS